MLSSTNIAPLFGTTETYEMSLPQTHKTPASLHYHLLTLFRFGYSTASPRAMVTIAVTTVWLISQKQSGSCWWCLSSPGSLVHGLQLLVAVRS